VEVVVDGQHVHAVGTSPSHSSILPLVFSHGLIVAGLQDLSMKITTPTLTWRWDTFALRSSHAADILSKHLFLPMVTLTSVAVGVSEAPRDMLGSDVEKVNSGLFNPTSRHYTNVSPSAPRQNGQNSARRTAHARPRVVYQTPRRVWSDADHADS
jgi:hypothetical protein